MNKKLIMGSLAASMMMSTVAFASPLADYSQGKASVEVGMSVAPAMVVEANGGKVDSDVKKKIYGGATVGLGNKLALQYDYRDSKMEPGNNDLSFRAQQYNLRYALNDQVSVALGSTHGRIGINNAEGSRDVLTVGVTAQKELAPNVTGWLGAGFGSGLQQYEAGIGLGLARNVDLDISYKFMKMNDVKVAGTNFDATTKGLYAGFTFKL